MNTFNNSTGWLVTNTNSINQTVATDIMNDGYKIPIVEYKLAYHGGSTLPVLATLSPK